MISKVSPLKKQLAYEVKSMYLAVLTFQKRYFKLGFIKMQIFVYLVYKLFSSENGKSHKKTYTLPSQD